MLVDPLLEIIVRMSYSLSGMFGPPSAQWSILIHSGALKIGINARLIALEQGEHGALAWSAGTLLPCTQPQQVNFVSK